MPENPIQADLSPAEWALIQALRDLPESSLRDRVHEVFGDLLFYIRNPRCQGMGPEGFPCGEPMNTCQACQEVWDLLELLSRRVQV